MESLRDPNKSHEMLLDPELERIEEFAGRLSCLSGVKTLQTSFDFDETQPVQRTSQRFMNYEYNPKSPLYLSTDLGFQGSDTEVSFEPYIVRGGKKSSHGVFFGELSFGGESPLRVAVKPHQGSEATESCLKDYFNNAAAAEVGFYTLKPVGFMVPDTELAYSLTVIDEGLTTLDSVNWGDFAQNIGNHPGMQETWLQIARQMAIMHTIGTMCHGDLAMRNIATTVEGGIFFIDWEYANISLLSPRDAEVRYGYSWRDLAVLVESMDSAAGGAGILHHELEDRWRSFCEIVFDEYKTCRLQIVEECSHHKCQLSSVQEELQILEHNLQAQL